MCVSVVHQMIFGACLIASSFLSLPLLAAQAGGDFSVKSVNLKQPVSTQTVVSVRNPLGDVRIRTSPLKQAEVTAVVQSLMPGQDSVEVRAVPRQDRIEIIVDPPSSGNFRGRVDLGLVLPATMSTILETKDGLIEAKGLAQHVSAKSTKGDIFLKVAGSFDAETDMGAIFAWIKPASLTSESSLKTGSGEIVLRFSQPADLNVKAATRGMISLGSEFKDRRSVLLQTGGEKLLPFGRATKMVEVRSRSGNIEIIADHSSSTIARPSVRKEDLRTLPQAPVWQPGNPIVEVPKNQHRRKE